MPPCHPTFEVIAFHAPVVERECVAPRAGSPASDRLILRQVIHTDTGLRQFTAPIEIWGKGIAAIGAALAAAPREIPTRGNLPRHSRSLAPARRALYLAAHRDFLLGKYPSRAACARAHALGYAAWCLWLSHHRDEVAKEIGRTPVLKSGGRML